MHHVYGDMDKVLRKYQMLPQEWINCVADSLADEALLQALRSNNFISNSFPFEEVREFIGVKQLTGSAQWQLSHYWGEKVARQLFNERNIIHAHSFDLVYW